MERTTFRLICAVEWPTVALLPCGADRSTEKKDGNHGMGVGCLDQRPNLNVIPSDTKWIKGSKVWPRVGVSVGKREKASAALKLARLHLTQEKRAKTVILNCEL